MQKIPNFYFNGCKLPKYSGMWPWCEFDKHLSCFFENHDYCIFGLRDYLIIEGRLDHTDLPESEDPDVFMICARQLLITCMQSKTSILDSISENSQIEPIVVFSDILLGLEKMISSVEEKNIAIWINGPPASLHSLNLEIVHSQLPHDHPDYRPPPHLRRRQFEISTMNEIQQSMLEGMGYIRHRVG